MHEERKMEEKCSPGLRTVLKSSPDATASMALSACMKEAAAPEAWDNLARLSIS